MSSMGKLDGRVVLITGAARMAANPLSDDSSYCTGAEFVADGGMLA
jgi:NAD(P)-dependent dehydrogenase (short-subunit alcohol dehydrogenase family)